MLVFSFKNLCAASMDLLFNKPVTQVIYKRLFSHWKIVFDKRSDIKEIDIWIVSFNMSQISMDWDKLSLFLSHTFINSVYNIHQSFLAFWHLTCCFIRLSFVATLKPVCVFVTRSMKKRNTEDGFSKSWLVLLNLVCGINSFAQTTF